MKAFLAFFAMACGATVATANAADMFLERCMGPMFAGEAFWYDRLEPSSSEALGLTPDGGLIASDPVYHVSDDGTALGTIQIGPARGCLVISASDAPLTITQAQFEEIVTTFDMSIPENCRGLPVEAGSTVTLAMGSTATPLGFFMNAAFEIAEDGPDSVMLWEVLNPSDPVVGCGAEP